MLEMEDMKPPDFDDLLAALYIPDIDAKDDIQSSPEEERDEVGAKASERENGSPSCFSCSPASQSDPPAVSVIVKNTVRSESSSEEEEDINAPGSGLASHVQVKFSPLTSELGPTLPADAAVESQIANGFDGSVPRNDGIVLSSTEVLSRQGSGVSSIQHSTDAINSLKPHLYHQSPTNPGHTSSTPPCPQSVFTHKSPQSPENAKACVMNSDEDDSEPDLGSPLVIQESPESPMSSSPKFKNRAKPLSELAVSPEVTPCDIPPLPHLSFSLGKPKPEEEQQPKSPTSTAPGIQMPKDCLPSVTVSESLKEEKYPEHVIDERDSPESPPPSETGLMVHNRNSSPDLLSTQSLPVGHNDFHQEKLMESNLSKEDKAGETQELSGTMSGEGGSLKEENSYLATKFQDTVSTSPAKPVLAPPRPLKVKIKMPTGSITKSLTEVAPKKNARATSRAVDSLKPSPELHNTRSKRELPQQAQLPATATGHVVCAVKEKTAVDTKPKVSLTAVSITKTASLPPISAPTPKISPGGINLRSLGQKTLNSGITLLASSPLLPAQSSSRPASIVNSTGAIISKNQTNLVEAFNKILNNKNLLPIYKPDLGSPLPSEWGIALPAQVR